MGRILQCSLLWGKNPLRKDHFDRTELEFIFVYILNFTEIERSPANMAESDWDTVTVLRKKGPTAAQAKSKQVSTNLFYSFPTFSSLFPLCTHTGIVATLVLLITTQL